MNLVHIDGTLTIRMNVMKYAKPVIPYIATDFRHQTLLNSRLLLSNLDQRKIL